MRARVFLLSALVFVLATLLASADSGIHASINTQHSPPSLTHREGSLPEDKTWTMNVSTTVDNCNWWNNFGDIIVGAPNATSEKLTFESVCATSLWGGTDIDVFNTGVKIASVRAARPP